MSEVTAAILRVQLRKLPKLVAEMLEVKMDLSRIVLAYPSIRRRWIADPAGDGAGYLMLRLASGEIAQAFQHSLAHIAAREQAFGLYSLLMKDSGLHLYYCNPSLINKRSVCGHHSAWELLENSFARHYEYGKGTLPNLDAIIAEVVIFPIPVGLDAAERQLLRKVFTEALAKLGLS
jgi:hypothetical protein